MSRIAVILVLLLPFTLISTGYTRTKKDTSITVVDRPYRTLVVMPLKNLSGNKDYDFLEKDLRIFIASEMKIFGTVIIRTDDISKPTNLPPGVSRKLVFNPDLKRRLILPDINTFTNSNNPILEDSDYVISGSFSGAHKKKEDLDWIFTIELSNTRSLKKEHVSKISLPYRHVLEYSAELTQPLKKYLNRGAGGNIRIISSNERTEVYSGNNYIGYAPVSYFLRDPTNILVFKKEACTTVTNIVMRSEVSTQMPQINVVLKKITTSHLISITSSPKGCRAYLNEKFMGITPLAGFPAEGSDAILFVTRSNYRSAFMKADLGQNRDFHFALKSEDSFRHPRFSNKSMAWNSFFVGTAFLCGSLYYFWQSEYYNKLYALNPSQSSIDKYNRNSTIGSIILLSAIPFFGATFYFTVRASDEKDW